MDTSSSSHRSMGPAQRKIIRSHSVKRRSKVTPVSDRVQLERVLGFTCNCNASLACDPNTGLIAYPAGCVVVVLNSKKNKQSFIQSKKTITCIAFSGDGRHLVTGECGYQPMVRVWDLEEKTQVAEFAGHKFGINCVVFSPNMKYIVSIGSQHDMSVSVWNWRSNTKVASNKVASKVTDISFSEDGSYFVTVGNRHVKFWYLDTTKSKVKEVVPLNGRSGILGEQKNNFFCGVACGRGVNASKTFSITQSGLLCEFNEKRLLDKWVELRVPSAQCITVSEQHIFSGCADGVLRVFSAASLHYVTSLPKPHYLGVDITAGTDASSMPSPSPDARFPDCVAVRYDDSNKKVTTVYNDHSLYVWDVSNLKKVGKARSYMYHSSCIWGVEVYPQLEETKSALPPGSFITCSSDDTIRIWNVDPHAESMKRNIYSQELLKVIYTDKDLNNIKDVDFNPAGKNDKTDTQSQEKNGVRCVKVSPDGQHLASGDRMGNIRIHDLQFMDQISDVEAHDSEVLCLEFTQPETGVRLLASASRDRLIHVFDVDQNYGLVQTLDDHSSAITSVRFSEQDGGLHMLSCGADKSILFRTAQQDPEFSFVLNRHLVGRTTLYDMDIDTTHKFVATACQDRNVRIYNIKNGKQKKCYKGSLGDDGTLIKVHLDPSGGYIATSCSNKTLAIMDFFTGECMSTMFGHSELVTGVRFTNDLKHLISVAADGCVFVWRLPLEFTQHMIGRMVDLGRMSKDQLISNHDARRGTFVVKPVISKSLGHLNANTDETDHSNKKTIDLSPIENDNEKNVDKNANDPRGGYRFSVGQLPAWAKRTAPPETPGKSGEESNNPVGPRGRWAQRVDNQGIIMKSMLDENSAIQLSLSSALDRRRFTVEQESIQEQIKAMRRDTIIKTESKHVPIITDDDETNKDDEEDDEFCLTREQKEKRLNSDHDPNKKIDGMITTSRGDGSIESHKSLIKTNSIDLLLDEGEEEEEEEEGDADSDHKEVIYFLPNEEGSESSETIASSFRIIEGDTTSYKDAESEGTDPLSLSDDESEPATPTTPGDPTKDFMSQAERDFEDLGTSPDLKESFTKTLDEIEQMSSGGNDPSRYFNHRLSISSRFISRAQTQHLRNLAMQNAAQQRNTINSSTNERPTLHGNPRQRRLPSVPEMVNGAIINRSPTRPDGGGWKSSGDEDTVPEKDSPSHLVSHRARPKLDPPPPPQPTRLSRVEAPRGRHSLGTDQESRSRRTNVEESKDFRSRRSMDSAHLSRQWKSMADMSGRVTPTYTKSGQPPRSRTPTSYRSSTPYRNHSPVRYVAKTEMKLDSPTRGRSLSTQDEESTKESLPQPRSKSATPLDNPSSFKRKSLPRQHSYAKPTESSSAKTSLGGAPTTTTTSTSPSKGRFANKKGGKLNTAMKSKFKSTPDLASALKVVEDLKPMHMSKTAEDLHDYDLERKKDMKEPKNVRRSMPATREMKDLFGLNAPAVEASLISEKQPNPLNTHRKVSIGESSVIDDTQLGHRKLPTPGSAPSLSKSPSDSIIVSKSQLNPNSSKEEEDRLRMPPPPIPTTSNVSKAGQEVFIKKAEFASAHNSASKRSTSELTLAQAKAILLGKSDSPGKAEKTSPERVMRSSPEKEEQSRPPPVQTVEKSLSRSQNSLDVPLEGSPDKDSVPPPGSSMFHKWDANVVMPMDLPVKDYSSGKHPRSYVSSTARRFGRPSQFDKPSVGEYDDGGDDIPHEGDAGEEGEPEARSTATTTITTTATSTNRRERSLSPSGDSSRSQLSTPGNSALSSPTRSRAGHPSPSNNTLTGRSLPELPVQSKTSPLSSGSTSPLHGSPRLRPRHLRKSDEGPVAFGHGLRIAFASEVNDSRDSSREGSLSPTQPPPPLEGGFGIPKSKSMPESISEGATDNKALDELCQSVTAKLDALVNKPLPGRSPKSTPQTAVSADWRRKSLSPGTDKAQGAATQEETQEGDTAEIKRPDKSRTMPPTSLTTSLPNAQSSAKVVLTSPAPADRSRLSLPVAKANTQPEAQADLDEDACTKMAADLRAAMETVIQAFNKIPKEKKQSHILHESMTSAQTALNDTLGASGGGSGSSNTGPDSNSKIISDAAEKLSDKVVDLLKAKLEQALQ